MKQLSKLFLSSIVALTALPTSLYAADLLSLYQKAENYDAEIVAAKSAYLAELQGKDIAFASLLPNLNASARLEHSDIDNNAYADDSQKSRVYRVGVSQPLINFASWYGVSSAEQNALRAEANYLAAQQNLILDVASAYFNVLRAQENLRSALSQEAASKRQFEQAKEQFDVGLIAITDVHEAKASYDASQTVRIRSEGEVTLGHENLARITGEYSRKLNTLKADFPIELSAQETADAWVKSAFENNLAIKAAEFELKRLQADFQASKSGHYPTLSLEAGYSNQDISNSQTNTNDPETTSIALNLNVPLYSGGATQARTRQTRHLVEAARQNLLSAQRQAQIETRSEFINLKTGIQTVESLKQNIVSRQSALEATKEGYNVGTRNIVEVLDAERNYYTALRDHANARFDFVESTLRIKRAAGTLSSADIASLNQWLVRE